MNKLKQIGWKQEIKNDISVLLGVVLMAISYNFFFVPNQISSGVVTGISTVLYYVFGWPIGLTSALINIPLFLCSFKQMGRVFAVRAFVTMLLLSLLIDLLPSQTLTDDLLLATIIGGVVQGAGLALVLMGNASTGGTDLAASMVHRLIPHLSVGTILLVIEVCIVSLSALEFGIQKALYSGVALYLVSRVTDMLQEGVASSRLLFIISKNSEAIAARVLEELERGVTSLSGRGLYSGKETQVLFCVVSKREVTRLKKIIHETDPSAFVVLTVANETLGEGFSRILPK